MSARGAGRIASALVALGLAACVPHVAAFTRTVARGLPAPDAETATLVVMRPGGALDQIHVLDGQGNFLAQLGPDQWTRISLPPGHHRVYAMVGTNSSWAAVLDLEVEAGLLYYASCPRSGVMWAVAPRHRDRWFHRDEWAPEGHEVEIDPARLAELEEAVPVRRRLEAIVGEDHDWDSMTADQRDDHTLFADDGVTEHIPHEPTDDELEARSAGGEAPAGS